MDLAALVTFPEGTLWRSGVSLQYRPSITTLLHYYLGRDRAFPGSIERGKSSPDQVDQSLTVSSRSVTVRGLFLPYLLQIEILRSDPSLRLIL